MWGPACPRQGPEAGAEWHAMACRASQTGALRCGSEALPPSGWHSPAGPRWHICACLSAERRETPLFPGGYGARRAMARYGVAEGLARANMPMTYFLNDFRGLRLWGLRPVAKRRAQPNPSGRKVKFYRPRGRGRGALLQVPPGPGRRPRRAPPCPIVTEQEQNIRHGITAI